MQTLTIRRPDDFHVHLRSGEILRMTVAETAKQFARALVMPNLRPDPVLDKRDAIQYLLRIGDVCRQRGIDGFAPLMTIQLTDGTDEETIRAAAEAGVVAGKLYPAGVTTNSENGVSDIESLRPVFKAMEDAGMMLCLHGESPYGFLDDVDREEAFLLALHELAGAFPDLKMVFEHVSTEAAVDAVRRLDNVAATVTPHHLVLTMDDVFGPRFRPHHFCKPTAKRRRDREAILGAVLDGHPKFFLGTDSAPHPRGEKESACCPAGVFSAPVAMPLLAKVFEQYGELKRLEDFASRFGAEWYGLPLNEGTLTLERTEWRVPAMLRTALEEYVPFLAGETLPWRLAG